MQCLVPFYNCLLVRSTKSISVKCGYVRVMKCVIKETVRWHCRTHSVFAKLLGNFLTVSAQSIIFVCLFLFFVLFWFVYLVVFFIFKGKIFSILLPAKCWQLKQLHTDTLNSVKLKKKMCQGSVTVELSPILLQMTQLKTLQL